MQDQLDRQDMTYAMQHEQILVCNYSTWNTMYLMEDLIDYDDISYPWFPKINFTSIEEVKERFLPKRDFLIHRDQHFDWYNLEQILQVLLVQHVSLPIVIEDVISIR